MPPELVNGYRKLGIGEAILSSDFILIDDALDPAPSSSVGCLIEQDDSFDFYRDTESRPTFRMEFTPAAEERPKAKTDDAGKAPLSQVPWEAVREMALVQAYGHSKYGDFHNYRKGMEVSRNVSCALRHITEWMDGVDNDSESGRSHLAHAMTRLAFVIQNITDGVAIDDRYRR